MNSSQSQPSGAPKSAATEAQPSAVFTPGPWRVVPYDCGDKDAWPGTPSVQAAPELDCAIVHWAGFKQRYWESARGRSEMDANARLIAAAPDMYEALRTIERISTDWGAQDCARAALAKAVGQQ